MRSGTENVIGIAGFGAAAKVGYEKLDEHIASITAVHDKIVSVLSDAKRFPGVELNTPDGPAAPHILSIHMPMVRSEVMLHSLSHAGIFGVERIGVLVEHRSRKLCAESVRARQP